jgi:hypothetical protein
VSFLFCVVAVCMMCVWPLFFCGEGGVVVSLFLMHELYTMMLYLESTVIIENGRE